MQGLERILHPTVRRAPGVPTSGLLELSRFIRFDPNPYVAIPPTSTDSRSTVTAGAFTVSLVSGHLYFASDSIRSKNRCRLETAPWFGWPRPRPERPWLTTDVVALGEAQFAEGGGR